MRKKPIKFEIDKFYVVRWLDAAEKENADDTEFGLVLETVGWVIKSNRHGIRIANERYVTESKEASDRYHRGLTDIPRTIIMSAKEVEVDE